ncbi:MAG: hypothetical protein WAT66_04750 [Actinomycetota bacterium]
MFNPPPPNDFMAGRPLPGLLIARLVADGLEELAIDPGESDLAGAQGNVAPSEASAVLRRVAQYLRLLPEDDPRIQRLTALKPTYETLAVVFARAGDWKIVRVDPETGEQDLGNLLDVFAASIAALKS